MMVVANASVLRCRARGAAGLQASPASPNTTAPTLAPTTAPYGRESMFELTSPRPTTEPAKEPSKADPAARAPRKRRTGPTIRQAECPHSREDGVVVIEGTVVEIHEAYRNMSRHPWATAATEPPSRITTTSWRWKLAGDCSHLGPLDALYGGTRGRGGRLRRALPSVPGGPSTGRGRPLDGLVLGGRARSPDEGAAATRRAVAGGGGCLNVGDVNWPRLTGHPQTSNGYGIEPTPLLVSRTSQGPVALGLRLR